MNPTDFAIIAGIERYHDTRVQALEGAGDDARRFHRWVTDPSGGAVPPENVSLFGDACYDEIKDAFVRLCLPAKESAYLGRRLYIFLAGHGIAQNLHEASLLAADGGPQAPDRHVPGWSWMNWFCLSAYFEEVVLFADCCRTAQRNWAVRPFPLDEVRGESAGSVRWVRGFATQYDGVALEQQDGAGRGLFTSALLDALEHARQVDGRVTASSVREHFLHHPDLAKWRSRQLPSLMVEGELVFSSGPPQLARVLLRAPEGVLPTITGGPESRTWEVRPGERPGEYVADLPRGVYAAKASGRETRFFEVIRVPEAINVAI